MGRLATLYSRLIGWLTTTEVVEVQSGESYDGAGGLTFDPNHNGQEATVVVRTTTRGLGGFTETYLDLSKERIVTIPVLWEDTERGIALQTVLVGAGYSIRYESVFALAEHDETL